jgi:hypothetical protein
MLYEFRAWDEEFKQYSEVAMEIKVGDIKWATDYVWELWTGKYDNEGNKIWQGDIVELSNSKMHVLTEIEWDNNSCGFLYKTSKNCWDFMESLDCYFSTVKVFGNIHEGVKLC